jgi:hypothetical protein
MSTAPLQTQSTPPGDTRRTIPFDYSFTFTLTGATDGIQSQTIHISIEAAFTAVAIGYGLIPEIEQFSFGPTVISDIDIPAPPIAAQLRVAVSRSRRFLRLNAPSQVIRQTIRRPPIPPAVLGQLDTVAASAQTVRQDLQNTISSIPPNSDDLLAHLPDQARQALVGTPRSISLGDVIRSLSRELGESSFVSAGAVGPLTAAALQNGIRLNPAVAKFFLQSDLNLELDPDQLAEFFVTVPPSPEQISFLYALHDDATGREFQSEPILNIAGLGIADGDRPFRYFAQPITFSPRSAVRLDIIPKSAFRGELHVSLHGYKVLGENNTPTGNWESRRRRLHR